MSRFGSLGTQYFDNSGEPLVNGLIYFYESGTTTLKTTYSDINQTVANTNPVVLTASGRQPNIFFTGVAKAVLATGDDVIIETRDPVGQTDAGGDFSEYIPSFDYPIGAIVRASNGLAYASLVTPNIGNEPSVSPTEWEPAIDYLLASQTVVPVGRVAVGNPTTGLAGVSGGNTGDLLTVTGTSPYVVGFSAPVPFEVNRVARTSNTIITSANKANLIEYTSGTFAQTFDASSDLGAGFFCYFKNSGTGVITLTPDGSETVSGGSSLRLGPNENVLIQSDGSDLFIVVEEKASSGSSLSLISTQTVSSAVSSIDFTTGINSTYDEYAIQLVDVKPATAGAALYLRTSPDGGSTFTSSAAAYMYNIAIQDPASTGIGAQANSTSATEIHLTGANVGNAAGERGVCGIIRLFAPSAALPLGFGWELQSMNQSSRTQRAYGVGHRSASEAINALRFYFSSGDIVSGSIRLYGVKKS